MKRKTKGYAKLSRETGYSLSHVSRVMRGQRRPTLECALKLYKTMGVTVEELAKKINIK